MIYESNLNTTDFVSEVDVGKASVTHISRWFLGGCMFWSVFPADASHYSATATLITLQRTLNLSLTHILILKNSIMIQFCQTNPDPLQIHRRQKLIAVCL